MVTVLLLIKGYADAIVGLQDLGIIDLSSCSILSEAKTLTWVSLHVAVIIR